MKALVILLVLARTAAAFPTGEQFDIDPMTMDGGGGIFFNGAPRWQGHTCAVCHTDAPGTIGIKLESDHPELFTTGWKPSTQYHLRVILENEHAAAQYKADGDNCGFVVTPYHPCDENGFALEMDDASGNPQGTYVTVVAGACATGMPPTDTDAVVTMDGTAVIHNGAHFGLTQWDFCWTSPAAGKGVITAYLATVDGNGGDGTMNFPNDTTGDDVASGAVPIAEAGAAPPAQTGGCSTGGGEGLALVVIALAMLRRRRVVALLLVATLASCTHVRPRQRETLAKRKMTFSPDPTEDELDLHMQESREGASGGYGSSGGGCGCN